MSSGPSLTPASALIVREVLREKKEQLAFFMTLKRVTPAEERNYQLQSSLVDIALEELEA